MKLLEMNKLPPDSAIPITVFTNSNGEITNMELNLETNNTTLNDNNNENNKIQETEKVDDITLDKMDEKAQKFFSERNIDLNTTVNTIQTDLKNLNITNINLKDPQDIIGLINECVQKLNDIATLAKNIMEKIPGAKFLYSNSQGLIKFTINRLITNSGIVDNINTLLPTIMQQLKDKIKTDQSQNNDETNSNATDRTKPNMEKILNDTFTIEYDKDSVSLSLNSTTKDKLASITFNFKDIVFIPDTKQLEKYLSDKEPTENIMDKVEEDSVINPIDVTQNDNENENNNNNLSIPSDTELKKPELNANNSEPAKTEPDVNENNNNNPPTTSDTELKKPELNANNSEPAKTEPDVNENNNNNNPPTTSDQSTKNDQSQSQENNEPQGGSRMKSKKTRKHHKKRTYKKKDNKSRKVRRRRTKKQIKTKK